MRRCDRKFYRMVLQSLSNDDLTVLYRQTASEYPSLGQMIADEQATRRAPRPIETGTEWRQERFKTEARVAVGTIS